MKQPIYLDYNATTPIDPQVAEAMLPYLYQQFGNPSSGHPYGQTTQAAVQKARLQVAQLLGCQDTQVIFTSGGTESNNYAIQGVARACQSRGNHIVTSVTEHPAVTEVCRYLETEGYRVTYLDVDDDGRISLADVEEAVTEETILVTIMHANNETGTLADIAAIAAIAHQHGALMHTDCAQSIGKTPTHVDELGVDLLTIAGHKLYAPKGVGALYVREGVELAKFMHGANHESNRRAGTENVLGIVGLGEACAMVSERFGPEQERLRQLRDRLEHGIRQGYPDIRINGASENRLPNTASISFLGLQAQDILAELKDDVAASAGAACHSEGVSISSVLEAMRIPLDYAAGTIRFSVGRHTTKEEIDYAIKAIIEVTKTLQEKEEQKRR